MALSTLVPFSDIATVWFNTWVACGRTFDPSGSTLPQKKTFSAPFQTQAHSQKHPPRAPKIAAANPESPQVAQDVGGMTFAELTRWLQKPPEGVRPQNPDTLVDTVPVIQTVDEQFDLASKEIDLLEPADGSVLPRHIRTKPKITGNLPLGVLEPPSKDHYIDEHVTHAVEIETNFLQISYLHRTVRDYLEQQRVWAELLSFVKDNNFDPKTALLAARALEVKTTGLLSALPSTPLHCSVYDFGIQILTWVGRLAPLTSYEHVELLRDISTVIGVHWIGNASKTPTHSIVATSDSGPLPQQFQTRIGLMSMAMQTLLKRCTAGKLDVPAISSRPPAVYFLAYALGVEF